VFSVGIYIDDERFDPMASLDLTSDKLVRAATDSAIAVTLAAAVVKKRIADAVQVADRLIIGSILGLSALRLR
jgi:hypothetical protein